LGSVDCHFHVIGPAANFPLHPSRAYTPPEASVPAWRAALAPLGFTHGVVVQPSIYGTDNAALLAALTQGAGDLVGVAAATDAVSDEALDALVSAGVRGLRFAHFEPGDARALPGFVPVAELRKLAPRMRTRNLHADLFTDSRLLGDIAQLLGDAGVPVVIDHLGRTPSTLGVAHEGVSQLREILEEGWCWVKLSGVANVSDRAPTFDDARPMHEWLVDNFSDRLVWGSDWPHTRPNGKHPDTRSIYGCLLAWTPEDKRRSVLLNNPRHLYRLG
jgi:predicted TIM-barrel fold metal-dependent hydrolase